MRLSEKINGSLSSSFIQSLNESYSEKLNETSSKELEAKKEDLRRREREALRDAGDKNPDNLVGVYRRLPEQLAKEFQSEDAELHSIDMIHSILTYAEQANWTPEYVLGSKYMQEYKQSLGEDRLKEIVNSEVLYWNEHATVLKNIYTDEEGVSYNTVEFEESKVEESCVDCKDKIEETDEIHGNELNEDIEVITFREIISRMEEANEFTDLYDAATLIKDDELRADVEQLVGVCEDEGDDVETAYSIITTDLLDRMIDEPNEEVASEE